MGAQLCTIADVRAIAVELSQDTRRGGVGGAVPSDMEAFINGAIDEASDCARLILQGRYDLNTIDASPPPTVSQFTRYKAVQKLYYNQLRSVVANEEVLIRINEQVKYYTKILEFGNLFTVTNDPIEAVGLVEATATGGTDETITELNLLFAEGR
jgi:hypothetical protein